MHKFNKYILYVVACAIVFLVFVKIFNGSIFSNSVNAFEWQKPVDVYFGNSKMGSNEDCAQVFPLSRNILNAETLGPGALEALLNSITESEKSSGYFTSLNDGILIQKFEIKDKVAYVDFSSRLNEGVAGSCKVTAIKSQIENTLNNLPDIDSIVISVNGETQGILEP
ncbi:MAG: GerMN domain-containing protein [Candidatus Paceibacterota bacterium]|jgi:spore germination protein GerM